jgi:ankyrin repeat protein
VSSDGNEVIDQPLICAVENGHLDSVKLLLQLGAANSGYPRRVSDGNTVLHIRCCLHFDSLSVNYNPQFNGTPEPNISAQCTQW